MTEATSEQEIGSEEAVNRRANEKARKRKAALCDQFRQIR